MYLEVNPMSMFDNLFPVYKRNPITNQVDIEREEPKVDDFFDPFFSRGIKANIQQKYGIPNIAIPLYGYSEFLENTLSPKDSNNILGPAMGILGGFGRTIDKAEDFLLGGITEGVNAFNQFNPLSNPAETEHNPIREIFVEDKDYTGDRLLASMANSMNKLAGGTQMMPEDFQNGVWKVPSLAIELGTDPGIAGNLISKTFNPRLLDKTSRGIIDDLTKQTTVKSAVGDIGRLMSNFDDVLARASWDVTAPGLRPLLKSNINKIRQLLASNSASPLKDVTLKDFDNPNIPSPPNKDDYTIIHKHNYKDEIDRALTNAQQAKSYPELYTYLNNQIDSLIKIASDRQDMDILDELGALKRDINNAIAPDALIQKLGSYDNLINQINDVAIKEGQQNYQNFIKIITTVYPDTFKAISTDIEGVDDFIVKGQPNLNPLDKDIFTSEDLEDMRYEAYKKVRREQHNNPVYNIHYTDKIKYPKEHIDYSDTDPEFTYNLSNMPLNEAYDIVTKEQYDKFINEFMNGENAPKDNWIHQAWINEFNDMLKKYKNKTSQSIIFTSSKFQNKSSKAGLIAANGIKNLYNTYQNDIANALKYFKENDDTKEILKQMQKINNNFGPKKFSEATLLEKTLDSISIIKDRLKKLDSYDNLVYKSPSVAQFLEQLDSITSLYEKGVVEKPLSNLNRMLTEYADLFTKDGNFDFLAYRRLLYNLKKNGFGDAMVTRDVHIPLADVIVGNFPNSIKPTDTVKDILSNSRYYDQLINPTFVKNAGINLGAKGPQALLELENIKQYLNMNLTKDMLTGKVIPTKESGLNRLVWDLRHTAGTQIPWGKDYLFKYDVNRFNINKLILPLQNKDIVLDNLNTLKNKGLLNTTEDIRQEASNYLAKLDTEDFAKYVYNENPIILEDEYKRAVEEYEQQLGIVDQNQKTLFEKLNGMLELPEKHIHGDLSTLHTDQVKNLLQNSSNLYKKGLGNDFNTLTEVEQNTRKKALEDTLTSHLLYRDALNGDTTPANSFFDELSSSDGINIGAFYKTSRKAEFEAANKAIDYNIAIINKNSPSKNPILTKFVYPIDKDKILLGYHWNSNNKLAAQDFSKLNRDNLGLKDIVWRQKESVETLEKYKKIKDTNPYLKWADLDELYEESRKVSEEWATTIGYKDFIPEYFKHARTDDNAVTEWLYNNIYKSVNNYKVADLNKVIQNYLKVNNQKAFLISPYTRTFRGGINRWNDLGIGKMFSNNPEEIIKKTFTEGMFSDSNFQMHVGLFKNPNFRISDYARTTQDLRDILFIKENGKYTGNLDNLVVAAPRYNKEGRLIGYQTFDKFSEKGLQQALDNPESIILPTKLLSPLDKILRKDMKMSNKVYAFINKYFTIPIKFGMLTNGGFLLGNVGDAYFKQALTMSKKYGTSFVEELVNVSESMKNVMYLENKFIETFDEYVKYAEQNNLLFNPYYKTTDSLISSSKARIQFEDWLKTASISPKKKDVANLWLYLNSKQSSSVFTGDFQNLGDLVTPKSEYAIPMNKIERIEKGGGLKKLKEPYVDKKTGKLVEYEKQKGIFVNNPVSDTILGWSGKYENLIRSSMILNDLTRRYSSKDIYRIIGNSDKIADKRLLNIKMLDAINTMSASNFDYEYISEVLDKFGTVVPFPTFVLKNMAYWTEIMVEHPEAIDSIITAQEVAWRNRDTKNDKFKQEAKGRGAIPFGNDNKFLKGIFKPTPYQSLFSAFDMLQNPVQNIAFRVNPLATPLTHHLQDAEDDKYRPYSTDPYQKNITRDDPNYSTLKATFHRLNPYERTLNAWLRAPSKAFGEGHNAQLSDLVPSVFQPDFGTKSTTKNKKR